MSLGIILKTSETNSLFNISKFDFFSSSSFSLENEIFKYL